MESARAGDTIVFTGIPIVVPDASALNAPTGTSKRVPKGGTVGL